MTRFPSRRCPDVLVDTCSIGAVEISFALRRSPIWRSDHLPKSSPDFSHAPWGTGTFCIDLCRVCYGCDDLFPDGTYKIACIVGSQIIGSQTFSIGPGQDN